MRTSNSVTSGLLGDKFEKAKKLLGSLFQRWSQMNPVARANSHQLVRLDSRAILSAVLPFQARISCDSGCIWVTQDNDLNDYILRAGEDIVLTRAGHVVITALGGSSILRVKTRPANQTNPKRIQKREVQK